MGLGLGLRWRAGGGLFCPGVALGAGLPQVLPLPVFFPPNLCTPVPCPHACCQPACVFPLSAPFPSPRSHRRFFSSPPALALLHRPIAGAVRPMQGFDAGSGAKVISRGELLAQRGDAGSMPAPASASGPSALTATLGATGNGCTDTPPSGSACQQQKVRGEGSGMRGIVCARGRGWVVLEDIERARVGSPSWVVTSLLPPPVP